MKTHIPSPPHTHTHTHRSSLLKQFLPLSQPAMASFSTRVSYTARLTKTTLGASTKWADSSSVRCLQTGTLDAVGRQKLWIVPTLATPPAPGYICWIKSLPTLVHHGSLQGRNYLHHNISDLGKVFDNSICALSWCVEFKGQVVHLYGPELP